MQSSALRGATIAGSCEDGKARLLRSVTELSQARRTSAPTVSRRQRSWRRATTGWRTGGRSRSWPASAETGGVARASAAAGCRCHPSPRPRSVRHCRPVAGAGHAAGIGGAGSALTPLGTSRPRGWSMRMRARARKTSAPTMTRPPIPTITTRRPKESRMAELDTRDRDRLRDSQFAYVAQAGGGPSADQ